MKLSNLSFLLATSTTAAAITHDDYDIPATSRLGQSLLQNARSLGNNNNVQEGTSWQAVYSIKFHSCATGDYFGGNNNNNDQDDNNKNNNNNNGNAAAQEGNNDGFVYKQRLAHFQLCPTNTCGSSKRGCNDYVTDLSDFLAMYVMNKMEIEAMACENVREGCSCEDDVTDDGLCYSDCYAQAGLSYCDQQQQQQDGGDNDNESGQYINLQEAVYCTQLDVSDEAMEYYLYNNQNQNNQDQQQQDLALFVGPHCHQGKVILGLFTEETCSIKAPRGSYEKMFYGQHLPHSSTSIVESKCMSCKVPNENDEYMNNNNNNNNNQKQNNKNGNGDMYYYKNGQMYQQQQQQVYEYEEEVEQVPDEVTEACSSLYAQSAKCEESLHVNGVYPDTRACNYIRTLKKDGFGFGALRANNMNVTQSILAGVFAATTIMFAGLSVYLHRMVKRSTVNVKLLSEEDGHDVVVVKSDSSSGTRLRDVMSRFQFRGRSVRA